MTDHVDGPEGSNRRYGYRKGWRLVYPDDGAMNIPHRLQQLTESPLASDDVKNKAKRLLSEITDDGRLPVNRFHAARDLIKQNNILSKRQIIKVGAEGRAAGHAIFMACQACENLRDRTITIASRQERASAILQIAAAISVLSETQFYLLGGDDDEQG